MSLMVLARTFHILYRIHHGTTGPLVVPGHTVKTLMVLGSGGHTGELLQLMKALDLSIYTPRIYITAASDTLSISRLRLSEQGVETQTKRENSHSSDTSNQTQTSAGQYSIEVVPRAREVGQGWTSTYFTTLWSLIFSAISVTRHRPNLILTNGPGTCVPVCLVALGLRILGICRNRVVFVESLCRVKTLSLSGRILYHLADDIIVQWPGLSKTYPRCKYLGRLI
ncbi:hypothetical protein Pmani_005625 [Petrolisthes manimaculis]|uniref:UDP-N-acetylglucosamine transferase subunit ALG14 n=1 Tax=Petrolisthes manimaculis TaxID=1843537 RepID=A0AAE1QBB2_9EUCA|nr:hypothetical protein Pmani_005625 [Petrolisthes manimaculis]